MIRTCEGEIVTHSLISRFVHLESLWESVEVGIKVSFVLQQHRHLFPPVLGPIVSIILCVREGEKYEREEREGKEVERASWIGREVEGAEEGASGGGGARFVGGAMGAEGRVGER